MRPSPVLAVIVLVALAALAGCRGQASRPGTAAGPSGGGGNPIRSENARAGTRDWLITQMQAVATTQPLERAVRRPAIEGYVSHQSITAGQTLTAFVSTDPPAPYKADVYRMGYYNGDGGRLVRSVGPLRGVAQPVPADGPGNLRDCAWAPSFTVDVPRDWVSGVYVAKLTNLADGNQSHMVFVVRDDRPADLLFQVSDITWQTYNRWPAFRSMYDWDKADGTHEPWWTRPGPDVSFRRPYAVYINLPMDENMQSNGAGEFLLWEFPLAYWLEQQGYDVSYVSNVDTHADPARLRKAKGFLSVGHDEYWTQEMFDNVARARDAGLNLIFLSGNALAGKIYLRPAPDGTPHKVVGRIESFDDEQDLMGNSSYGVGFADWVCQMPDHWLFAGTGMKAGDRIEKIVGWEYHGPPNKDDPSLEVVAASPLRRWDPAKRHSGVVYYGPKGNFVFNAGTCWWNLLLATPPGFRSPPPLQPTYTFDFSRPDPRLQRITQNALDRAVRSDWPSVD